MSLTAEDLGSIRSIVREESRDAIAAETRNFFQNEGRDILRDVVVGEVKSIFQTDGREIIRDIFQTDGRQIVREAVHIAIDSLKSKVTALENDIKEIYFILARIEKRMSGYDKKFTKLGV